MNVSIYTSLINDNASRKQGALILQTGVTNMTTISKVNLTNARQEYQTACNDFFASWPTLAEAMARLETYQSGEYSFDRHGGLNYSVSINLTGLDEDEVQQLGEYLCEFYDYYLNVENSRIDRYCGDDYISIQYDTRSDNGVWQGHRLIITEDKYTNEAGDIDEDLRNELIEKHMEKTGYFPEVIEVDRDCNVTLINTKKG